MDTTAPVAADDLAITPDTGFSNMDGLTYASNITFSGSVPADAASVQVYDETTGTDLGPATIDGLSFTKEIAFAQAGAHQLRVRVADEAGNATDSFFDVFVDGVDLTVAAWGGIPTEAVGTAVGQAIVTFSKAIDVSTFTLDDVALIFDGTPLDPAAIGVTLNAVSNVEFQLGGLPNLGSGDYAISLDMADIAKYSSGRTGAGFETAAWTVSDTERPTVVETQIQDGGAVHIAVDHFTVRFSEPMNVQELLDSGTIVSAVRLTRSPVQGMPISEIVDLSQGAFTWDSANQLLGWQAGASQTLAPGWYELQLNSDAFQDISGNPLLGEGTPATPFGTPKYISFGGLTVVGGSEASVAAYAAPTFGDYNGDGVDDLIVGQKSADGMGRIVVFLNAGSNSSPIYAAGETVPDPVVVTGSGCLGASPYWGDWNGDGLGDLLVGTALGNVVFFENIGTSTAPEFAAAQTVWAGLYGGKSPIDVGPRAMIDVVDYNADGRNDLLVGDVGGRIQVFFNQADSGEPDLASGQAVQVGGQQLQVPSGRAAPRAVDLDGDGRLDLVAGNTEGELWFYQNVGSTAAPDYLSGVRLTSVTGEPIDLPIMPRSRPAIADLNGDGVLDVVLGAQDGSLALYTGIGPAENDVTHFSVIPTDPPLVSAVGVNDGAAQRSMVTSLEVVFDQEVTLDPEASLTLLDATGAAVDLDIANPSGDGRTYVATFADPNFIGGSLPDGPVPPHRRGRHDHQRRGNAVRRGFRLRLRSVIRRRRRRSGHRQRRPGRIAVGLGLLGRRSRLQPRVRLG